MNFAKPKSFVGVTKEMVWQAYKAVRANGGAGGVDGKSIEDFESDLGNNRYKIWNRLASGSYFPPSVLAVAWASPTPDTFQSQSAACWGGWKKSLAENCV